MEKSKVISRGVKQESSVPVQSRVSVMTLAELDNYWNSEGYEIRSMSQLVSWSLDLLCEILDSNKLLTRVESIGEAHSYLKKKGLYQRSLEKRSFKKITKDIKYEREG